MTVDRDELAEVIDDAPRFATPLDMADHILASGVIPSLSLVRAETLEEAADDWDAESMRLATILEDNRDQRIALEEAATLARSRAAAIRQDQGDNS